MATVVPLFPAAVVVLLLLVWLVVLSVGVSRARRKCRWEAQRALSRALADLREPPARKRPSPTVAEPPTGPVCINGRTGSTASHLRGNTPATTPIQAVGRHTQL